MQVIGWYTASVSLQSRGNTRSDLRYHFVFIPKYRKRVLTGEIARKIEGMIRFACQIHEWQVYDLAICHDHVHLFVQTWPKDSPSFIMNTIKGGTAKKIRELFPELEEIYWGASFWADGYLAKSVGDYNAKVVSQYIKNQLEKEKTQAS